MKINELGEFGLVGRTQPQFAGLLPEGFTGIGDDCAVFPISAGEDMVVSTDMLVEGTHFLPGKISFQDLGHKTLAVNLSDIAAMGARPTGSFLSVGLPPGTGVAQWDAFMQGYHALSKQHQVPLLGGDTTQSEKGWVVNVAVLGRLPHGEALLRSAAQTGDAIFVTGPLGNSAGGLKALQEGLPLDGGLRKLVHNHHHPAPRLDEGQWLRQQNAVHAALDISDGLASDLPHILRASQKGAQVEVHHVPLCDALKNACRTHNWPLWDLALAGGEDYELLLTVHAAHAQSLQEAYHKHFGAPLYRIGQITATPGDIQWLRNGHPTSFTHTGYRHF